MTHHPFGGITSCTPEELTNLATSPSQDERPGTERELYGWLFQS